jgi:hypothetical protein
MALWEQRMPSAKSDSLETGLSLQGSELMPTKEGQSACFLLMASLSNHSFIWNFAPGISFFFLSFFFFFFCSPGA